MLRRGWRGVRGIVRGIRKTCGRGAITAALGAVLVAAAVAGGGAGTGAAAQTGAATSEWPHPGGDYANSRAAVGSTIDASNVAGLAKAWEVTTPGSLTTAVVVVGDTIYMEDSRCVITAIDRATGKVEWQSASVGFTIGPQGVSVGDGAVFATTPTGAIALEQDTGQLVDGDDVDGLRGRRLRDDHDASSGRTTDARRRASWNRSRVDG